MKQIETKTTVVEEEQQTTPAAGRVQLRCLSCDKSMPLSMLNERPYTGSPKHGGCVSPPPLVEDEHHHCDPRYVDIVARQKSNRPQSSSAYEAR